VLCASQQLSAFGGAQTTPLSPGGNGGGREQWAESEGETDAGWEETRKHREALRSKVEGMVRRERGTGKQGLG
jgi:hypothetical protein